MPPVSNAPIIAAIIAKKRRKILKRSAHRRQLPRLTEKLLLISGKELQSLRIQVRRKVIVQLQDDKYYLDEARSKEIDQLRHRLALISLRLLL